MITENARNEKPFMEYEKPVMEIEETGDIDIITESVDDGDDGDTPWGPGL